MRQQQYLLPTIKLIHTLYLQLQLLLVPISLLQIVKTQPPVPSRNIQIVTIVPNDRQFLNQIRLDPVVVGDLVDCSQPVVRPHFDAIGVETGDGI